MAKGIGLIGNFKGKVGNMVGYHLSDSNTGNTQGIRVYQPIVKNPKTAAQAEQRAKLAPINATYRALKMVIDRGNEGLPYGNKSRLAWLKQAFKATGMPWYIKGAQIGLPVICQLTKGSLPSVIYNVSRSTLKMDASTAEAATPIATVGALSTVLLLSYSFLKAGDQITFVGIMPSNSAISAEIFSVVLDTTSTEALSDFTAEDGEIQVDFSDGTSAAAIIISREGANGEHLRSTTSLIADPQVIAAAPYDATSKADAIESYQNAAGANSDWAEESIQ